MATKRAHILSGTGVAVVTPFGKDGSVDYAALTNVINHIIKGKCEYLVIMGTTGESPTLMKDEKKNVLRHALETTAGRVPVVYGVGGNNTLETCHALEHTDFSGVTAILSVAPFYNKPNQRGLYEHYKAVADASPLPVIMYNVPARTGMNMTADTTLRLAHDFPRLVAMKEASGNLEQIMAVIKDAPKDFLTISGDDMLTLPLIAAGAHGVISVVANAFPRRLSDMVRHALAGDFAKARPLHYDLMRVTQLFFADGSPGGVKASLEAQKICKAHLRLPLMPVNEQVHAEIVKETKRLK